MNTSMLSMENEMTSDMEEFATNITGVVSDLDGVATNLTGLTSDFTDLQMELDENLQKISKNFSLLFPSDNGTFCKYLLFFWLFSYTKVILQM